MQTFLPYSDFAQAAACLDQARLGKQRAEVKQLAHGLLKIDNLRTLTHPASKMWADYVPALLTYGMVICEEWIGRGYQDTVHDQLYQLFLDLREPLVLPPWMGGPIHANHRARLLEKNPIYYGQFGWKETSISYNYWPVL